MAVLQRPQRDPSTLSRFERYVADQIALGYDAQEAVSAFLKTLPAGERQRLRYAWHAVWARPAQQLPEGEWDTLFIRAGRGYGKTRIGSEGTRRLVLAGRARAVTIIGQTAADARDVMIENPLSGLLAVHPPEVRPVYEPSKRLVTWPNGAVGHVRSAEEPDGTRGLESELVWGDEPASWKTGSAAWDNAMLGNRLGRPHAILTGTPRPLPWLRAIEAEAGTVVRTGSTYENIGNLARQFIDRVIRVYEGTRLGQQELHAQYLEDVEGALWRFVSIELGRIMPYNVADPKVVGWSQHDPWGSLERALTLDRRIAQGLGPYVPTRGERRPWVTWVGVDPPGETAECGIIVATAPRNGRAGHDHAVVLEDMTVAGPPEVWGAQVVRAVRQWSAAGAAVESNQGGDMVRATVHNVDPNVKVEKVRAVDSKADRAEPISVLYPAWVHHLGVLGGVESQMTTWVPTETKGKSPDRLDALVHVLTKLLSPQSIGTGSVHSPLLGGRAA